ncbi:hypothetical protein [Parasitella parasitica]|uniref:Uncharacterized protein n=1 Tax=Parasitella parasitica TaxID=35722 RepID=A0A0B7MWR7_9FUNG|nr:hypothetical protein [Parasitella parasitica]
MSPTVIILAWCVSNRKPKNVLISSICNNMKGVVFTSEVSKLRELKHGNPISRILQNFAKGLLLCSILDGT